MKYYAAYGSNLHLEQMKERCPNAIPIGTARLADWKLVFKGDKGEFYLSIVPKKGAFADAGIWQVDAQDEAALDEYEEYPALYKKFTLDLPVSFFDGHRESLPVFLYAIPLGFADGRPEEEYVQICEAGCHDFGLDPPPLFAALERVPAQTGQKS